MPFKISIFSIFLYATVYTKHLVNCSIISGSFEAVLCQYTGFSDIKSKICPPPLRDQYNYSDAVDYAETDFYRLKTYENNIMKGGVQISNATPTQKAMLISRADDAALNISSNSYINNKASLYILHSYCMKYGVTAPICVGGMKRISKQFTNKPNCSISKYRKHNGYCNNYKMPSWGSTYTPYSRLLPAHYKDGIWSTNIAAHISNPWYISSEIAKQIDRTQTKYNLVLAGWTNLVSYDVAHTVSYRMMHTGANIMCCSGQNTKLLPRYRHPLCMPIIDSDYICINYVRSMLSIPYDQLFGSGQQMNAVTHYLDGSTIYGSTPEIADNLRLKIKGHLKIFDDNCKKGESCLITGDIRPNMDPISAVIHTVLMREHNRIATSLFEINQQWDDEVLYQEARRIVIAEIQHITYKEWLPILTGEDLLDEPYDSNVDPSVYNSFANAAILFVTSLLDNELSLYNEDRSSKSNFPMRFSIVEPDMVLNQETMDSLIRTLVTQTCKANDLIFSEALTKYFYSEGNETGLNALSLIIQRSRDHGLPSYLYFRKMFNLPYKNSLELARDIPLQTLEILKKFSSDLDTLDLFIGGMAEKPRNRALLGPTFAKIFNRQMIRTKAGDKYFYDNPLQEYPFTKEQINEIKKASLARLLCDNSDGVKTMQPNAFLKFDLYKNKLVSCREETEIKKINLQYWKQ